MDPKKTNVIFIITLSIMVWVNYSYSNEFSWNDLWLRSISQTVVITLGICSVEILFFKGRIPRNEINIEDHWLIALALLIVCFFLLGKFATIALIIVYICYFIDPDYLKESFMKTIDGRYFIPVLFVICFSILTYISFNYTRHFPIVTDELSYAFSAKLYASGHSVLKTVVEPGFYIGHMQIVSPEFIYSKYSPGNSLTLAIGYVLGIPSIFPLLMAALTSVIFYFVAKEVYDTQTAKIAALICISSPFFILTSQTLLSEVSNLFYLSLFSLFFIRTSKEQRLLNPLIAGACLGMAFITRMSTTPAYAIPYVILAVFSVFFNLRFDGRTVRLKTTVRWDKLTKYAIFTIVFIVIFLGQLRYNQVMTDDPFLLPFQKYDQMDKLIFKLHERCGDSTISECLKNTLIERYYHHTSRNLYALYQTATGWPFLSLIFLAIALTSTKKSKWDLVFLVSALSMMLLYSFYYYAGALLTGPIYWYEMLLPVVILISRGVLRSIQLVERAFRSRPQALHMYVAFLVIVFFSGYQGLFHPDAGCWANGSELDMCNNIHKLSEMERYRNAVPNHIAQQGIKNAVVFIKGFSIDNPSYWIYTSPDPKEDILYFIYLNDRKNERLMLQYPGRACYVYEYTNDSNIEKCKF